MISKEAKKEIKKAKKVDNMKKQGKYYEKQNGPTESYHYHILIQKKFE